MQFSNLGLAVLSASSFSAVRANSQSQNINCTHMVLGPAKSKTTAVARALCEVLQREGGASCLHEPLRMLHFDDSLPPDQRVAPRFQPAENNLCKDMLYQVTDSDAYKKLLGTKIEKTENAVVFIEGNPQNSFLSLLDLALAHTDGLYLKNVGINFRDELHVERVQDIIQSLISTVINEILGTAQGYLEMTDVAKNAGKEVITIRDEELISQPKDALNKVLSSWGKPEIGPEHEMTMASLIQWGGSSVISSEVVKNSYQLAEKDPWDTVKGKVFAPGEVLRSTDERINAMLKKYVPKYEWADFKKVVNEAYDSIAVSIEEIGRKYTAAKLDQASNEL